MKRLALVLLLALALVRASLADPFRTEVRFRKVANLVYQLDAVIGVIPTDGSDYEALWKREFLKTPEDQAALESWRLLRDRYSTSVEIPIEGEFPLERPQSSVSPFDKIRLASFQSSNRTDFLERLELVLTPPDIAVADGVLRRFEGPFGAWWTREAEKRGQSFVQKLDRLLKKPERRRQIEQFRSFYEARQPAGSLCSFNLMYRPEAKRGSTAGQQLENYAVVEFLPGEVPEDRLDVVVHELCHYFYSITPGSVRQKFQADFMKSHNPGSTPAFLLLNEGLATAFGNGMVARSVKSPEKFAQLKAKPLSFYNNEGIDRSGKALLSFLDRFLEQKRTIADPEFVNEYIKNLETEFGASLTAPRRFLAGLFLFVEEPLGQGLVRDARQILSVAGMYSSVGPIESPQNFGSYAANPNLSAVLIVRPESLDTLSARFTLPEGAWAAIKDAVARDGAAVFGYERSPQAIGVIVVAPDAARALPLLQRLKDAPTRFTGILRGAVQ